MWIRFDSRDCFAITVRVGGVNAISGEPLLENQASTLRRLSLIANGKSVQDYVVTPNQLWLDGVASNDGSVRQFVAMPLGSGYSIEAQVTGEDLVGGLQFEITPSTKPPKVVIAPPIPSDALYPSKELFVETPTGQMIVIQNISSHHFLDQVKEMIAQKEGIPVDEQRLIYDGRQLSDGRYALLRNLKVCSLTFLGYTLGDYEIPDVRSPSSPPASASLAKTQIRKPSFFFFSAFAAAVLRQKNRSWGLHPAALSNNASSKTPIQPPSGSPSVPSASTSKSSTPRPFVKSPARIRPKHPSQQKLTLATASHSSRSSTRSHQSKEGSKTSSPSERLTVPGQEEIPRRNEHVQLTTSLL